MWMLSFLPTSFLLVIINAILLIGVVFTVLGFVLRFQALAPYRAVCQLLGILALSAGLYFKGGYSVEVEWRAKVEALQAKVDEAEKKANEYNILLEEEHKKKQKVIHDTKVVIKKEIEEKIKVIDADCKVAPEAIEILNKATINPLGGKK